MNISDAAREAAKHWHENRHLVEEAVQHGINTATAALTLELETVKRERDAMRDGWKSATVKMTEQDKEIERLHRKVDAKMPTCGHCRGEIGVVLTTCADRAAGELAIKERDQLRQQLAEARELLKDRVFWTANDPAYSRQGYSALIDSETSFRDVNYRNTPLYPTAEEAIDAALNPPTDEK